MAAKEPRTKPKVVEAIRAVLQEPFDDETAYSRVEIRITGGGAVPYRLFPADGGDYVGGVAFLKESAS